MKILVGQDVDVLMILTARTLVTQQFFFLKPGKKMLKGNYSSRSFNGYHLIRDQILFLHAFSGCYMTFALSHKGKSSALKLMTKREDLRLATHVFNSQNVLSDNMIENGIKLYSVIMKHPSTKPLSMSRDTRVLLNL